MASSSQELKPPQKPGRFTTADVCITAVEIALDAYPRNPADCSAEALAMVAHHLHRHHARPPAGVPRITERKHYRAAARPRGNLRALTAGWSINAGERSSSYASRAYAKTHDTRDGEQYELLPVDQHRARFEITLRGEQLPFTDLAGWWAFRFETLARRFALRRSTTTPADALLHLLGLERAQIGRPDDPAKRAVHRRQTLKSTRADRLMNEAIRVALRHLTRDQKCGNSDRFLAAEVAVTEREPPAAD